MGEIMRSDEPGHIANQFSAALKAATAGQAAKSY
jgi:hypothetical protein